MIGFFGGAFDPVHFGHLKSASALKNELNLSQLFLLPCSISAHKKHLYFSAKTRLKMLQIACENFNMLSIDTRELQQKTTNYTINTLKNIRADYPNKSICFIIGADNYAQLSTWKDYQYLPDYAHLVVLPRPDYMPEKPKTTTTVADLNATNNGLLYFAKTKPLAISSTQIISKIRKGESLCELLPENIINYINICNSNNN